MKDEELLRELRDAARRVDAQPTGTPLDAPLGETFEREVAARILAERARARPPKAARPRLVYLAPLATLAAAAALLIFLRRPALPTGGELPVYGLSVTGGVDIERSADPADRTSLAARADAPVTLLLRPATDVRAPLVARLFVSRDGSLREVTAGVRTSGTGSVEVSGRLGALAGDAPGTATLVVVITHAGAEIDAPAIAASTTPPPAGVVERRVMVRVLP